MHTIDVVPSVVSVAVIMIALGGAATTPAARKFVVRLGTGMVAVLILMVMVLFVLLIARVVSPPLYEILLYAAVSLFFIALIPIVSWANGRLAAMREKGGPKGSA
ncbi:MAG TPA: hypothetical protein VMX94_01960 [Armatimonadota bacterium]|nr:hypothetical protein [Armatimonadota bacterium]